MGTTSQIEPLETRLLFSTYTVTTLGDAAGTVTATGAGKFNATTLRAAVKAANAQAGTDTINFKSGLSGTITLKSGELSIASDISLFGPGAEQIVVSGNNASRVVNIAQGVTVSISGLTVAYGDAGKATDDEPDVDNQGGGISNAGTLHLSDSTIRNNRSYADAGIFNSGVIVVTRCDIRDNSTWSWGAGGLGNVGLATIVDCSITNNRANHGGGIVNSAEMYISGTTISGNFAGRFPGVAPFDGVDGLGGGLRSGRTVVIWNSTIANNVATVGGGAVWAWYPTIGTNVTITGNSAPSGGAIYGGQVEFNNSIIVGNWAGAVANDFSFASLSEGSHNNLVGVGTDSGGLVNGFNGNKVGVTLAQLKLGPLANNGGRTQTMALLPGSIAVNAGSNALALDPNGKQLATDQRGLPRITNGKVDIGATEVQSLPVVTGFVLVNADTNKDIMPVTEGMTLDLATLPRRLNIRAIASGNAKSVQVVFDGQSRLELQAFWSAFGDWNGDYIFGNLAAGSHALTGQAFTGKAGTGTAGPITTLHFKVINKAPAPASSVTAFVLFNTATGKDIRVLHNYDTLDLSLLPATLGIRVQTSGTVGSVQYVVDGKMNAPATNALVVGQHHLTAIPYSGVNATGTSGASLEIHLFVVRSPVASVLQKPLGSVLVS